LYQRSLNPLKKLFKQTFIYGLATVLPKMLSFLLTPLYVATLPSTDEFGEVSIIFAWFAIFNVILAYGMETAFFRFFHKAANKENVITTSLISIAGSTLIFLILAFAFQSFLANITEIDLKYIRYTIIILALDALVIIPFAWLRAKEKPMRYAWIKVANVFINLSLNVFFLKILPQLVQENPTGIWSTLYQPNFEISYIFISNLIASGLTLLFMLRLYLRKAYVFDTAMWKKMIGYAMPVMVAGIAYTINEVFGRIMLKKLLPEAIAEGKIGEYSACLKIAVFMTLFVILGSIILLGVVVFADVLKLLIVPNETYWEAMNVVPIVILAAFFLGIYHNLSVWYKVTDRTKFGAYISIVGAVLTIAINFFLIEKIGYLASAIATLSAYGTMMVLSYLFGKKYYPVPYNMRKISFYLGVSILFSAISFYGFRGNLYLGAALLLVFLGMVYKLENDKLKKIFLKK